MRNAVPRRSRPLRAAVALVLISFIAACSSPEPVPAPTSPAAPTSVPAPTPAHSFVGDFVTGNFDQWAICQNVAVGSTPCANDHSSSYSMQIEKTVVREGSRFAARFEVHQGDAPNGICCGDRAEVSGEEATRADEGDDRWYQWSTRFASGFPADRGWTVLSQWHADQDGSPPLAIDAGPTNVGVNRWGIVISTWNAPDVPGPTFTPWSAPIAADVWTDIKLHVKWSTQDQVGFIELWVAGVPQVFSAAPCAGATRCMVRTLMPDGGGVYFKQGYYRDSKIAPPGIVYHDGFSQATTEAGLAPL
ncbi:heparin lyase I family protein [Nocardia sp. NPDC051570]|uniref:heparin lyase I family protein n=1 Tax=Nocardia sp. NPDC051570 TaxID=3364324 RepID=UPI00379304BB